MRELFFRLFSDTPTGCGLAIESFNVWHFVYIILIFGGAITAAVLMQKKDVSTKERLLGILACMLVVSYISDYFVHDFVYADFVDGEYIAAGLNMDKLPFHICTVMCPIIAFTQFNKRFFKFIEPVAVLAIVAPLMYLTYPSTGVGGEPWCYRTVQTMFFHGVEFAWGFLTVAFGKTKLSYKSIWKVAVMLVGITLWAKLGNAMLGYNWFFLEEDPFGMGLPPWALLFVTPIAIFIIAVAVYGIYYGTVAYINKRKQIKNQNEN